MELAQNLFTGTVEGITFLVGVHEAIMCLAVSPTSPFLQLVYAPGIYSAMRSKMIEVHDGSLVFISGNPQNSTARFIIPMDTEQIFKETINAQVPSRDEVDTMTGDDIGK